MAKVEIRAIPQEQPGTLLEISLAMPTDLLVEIRAIPGVAWAAKKKSGTFLVSLYKPLDDKTITAIKALADGKEPQPEPKSLSEQAAVLGEKVGSCGGPTVGAALCYLKAVDQARSGAPEAWLWQIALHIFRRLRHGNWC